MTRLDISLALLALAITTPSAARAATGVCDASGSAPQACLDAIATSGTVVNDVFRDANGMDAPSLVLYGALFQNWSGCSTVNAVGCSGQSLAPYDCPGQYQCTPSTSNALSAVAPVVATLDRLWASPCRLADHTLSGACPAWNVCVADGVGGGYFPWEGLVFDLGASANRVALFAALDHAPEPCESIEYTVFLSDNPFSVEQVLNPASSGVDPTRWNRASLTTLYTKGFVETRPADPTGHAGCGDTAQLSVEMDAMVPVFALPSGSRLRYAAIVAGNDGLDYAECAYDSNDAELDAVAGLDETNAALCPDADHDLYGDCNCTIASPLDCDCNDADPSIHPGAPEGCDLVDSNCDGSLDDATCANGTCSGGTCVLGTGGSGGTAGAAGSAAAGAAGSATAGAAGASGSAGSSSTTGGTAGSAGSTGSPGGSAGHGGATSTTGGSTSSGGSVATGGTSTSGAGGAAGSTSTSGDKGGCSCRAASTQTDARAALALGLIVAAARRRRRPGARR